MFRKSIVDACAWGLHVYTKYSPFKRGRGLFIRAIEMLKRRGWPPPLTRINGDLVMEFEPSLLGWTLFERGQWEPPQTALLSGLMKPGMVVLDVGANTGYYVLLAASAVGTGGHVYAFEIQPEIIEILRRNVARNGFEDRVTIVASGCFSAEGEAFVEPHGDPGSARIGFASNAHRVSLTTIDRYAAAERFQRVDLILIDAEGADFEVLKGAADLLSTFRPVVIAEVHHLAAFGGSEEKLCAFMARFGYTSRPIQGEFSRDVLFQPT